MTLGPLMADIEGYELTPEDRELLVHPAIGGVILFARNYGSAGQVAALVAAIHKLRGQFDPIINARGPGPSSFKQSLGLNREQLPYVSAINFYLMGDNIEFR